MQLIFHCISSTMFTFLRLIFLAIIENCDTCFTYANTPLLVFSTFWIYSYATTNFLVLVRYFPFCKKILNFFRSLSAVSGLGSIEKLYLWKERTTTIVSGLGSLLWKNKTEIRSSLAKSCRGLCTGKKLRCRGRSNFSYGNYQKGLHHWIPHPQNSHYLIYTCTWFQIFFK